MKRLNTWFALILIPSALLLSAAPKGSAQEQSPRVSVKPTEQRALVQQPSANQPSPLHVSAATATPPNANGSKEESNHGKDDSTLMLWFVGISAVATALIALFNWQLVGVTDEMKQAAKIALKIDRPYLIPESVELKNFWPAERKPPARPVMAEFVLRNHGKGVAASPYARARLDVVEVDLPKAADEPLPPEDRRYPRLGNHLRCEHQPSREQAIPPGAASAIYQIILGGDAGMFDTRISFLSEAQFAALTIEWDALENRGPNVQIVLHIVLRYRDVIGNLYTSESIWTYWPATRPDESGHFALSQWGG